MVGHPSSDSRPSQQLLRSCFPPVAAVNFDPSSLTGTKYAGLHTQWLGSLMSLLFDDSPDDDDDAIVTNKY